MLRNKHFKSLLPEGLLWRLTFINIFIIASFIVLSSWAIYNTACYLADDLGARGPQNQFDSTLFQYLLIFSTSAIVIGSLIHFYLVRKLIRPIRKLIQSTKTMKRGQYPSPIDVTSDDEMGQLTGHFNDLVQQLHDNQVHRQKLVSDISHELRTPLSNLNGYLHALNNGVIEGEAKLYQSLHEEAKRLTTMVDQLEQLKEWDYIATQTFTEKESMDMQLLIEQSVDLFRWSLDKNSITADVEAEVGEVSVNNGGIQQVIGNLIDNAIRHYDGTGTIIVRGKNEGNTYLFTISGPGREIPESKSNEIFERFYRIDPSRARDSGGTGLGLAISKEIIEHHQGEIGVTSTGNHHTFWFTIPLSKR